MLALQFGVEAREQECHGGIDRELGQLLLKLLRRSISQVMEGSNDTVLRKVSHVFSFTET